MPPESLLRGLPLRNARYAETVEVPHLNRERLQGPIVLPR